MNAQINQNMSLQDWVILIVLSVLWGGSFFFVEVLVDYLPPLTIVNIRVAIAAILLWAILFSKRLALPRKLSHWLALFVIGFLNNALPFCLIVWGQTQINSGLASVLNATVPFFTVVVAGLLLTDERFSAKKITGVLFGIIGVAILIGPDSLRGDSGSVLGQLAVIAAALSYAFAAVFSRRFKRWGISPLMIATGQVTSAAIMLLPLTFIFEQPLTLPLPPLIAIGAMIGLAVFSTVAAYILYFRLISSAGATNAALVAFLIPVSALLLGIAFLGERFTLLQAAGMALIGAGLLVMDGRLLVRVRERFKR